MTILYKTEYNSPFGKLTLAGTGQFLTGLWFEGQKYFPENPMKNNRAPFDAALFWLDRYFSGKKPAVPKFSLNPSNKINFASKGGSNPNFAAGNSVIVDFSAGNPSGLIVAPCGSDFRLKVWKILLEIPYGKTVTYGEIAKRAGVLSPRAIGGAVGHNPISIIIPCHRVIGASGALTGYSAGVERKKDLLKHEGIKI